MSLNPEPEAYVLGLITGAVITVSLLALNKHQHELIYFALLGVVAGVVLVAAMWFSGVLLK
jgi:hypothetical protein